MKKNGMPICSFVQRMKCIQAHIPFLAWTSLTYELLDFTLDLVLECVKWKYIYEAKNQCIVSSRNTYQ